MALVSAQTAATTTTTTTTTTTATTRASLQNNPATSGVNCTSVHQLLLDKGGVCVVISQAVQMQV